MLIITTLSTISSFHTTTPPSFHFLLSAPFIPFLLPQTNKHKRRTGINLKGNMLGGLVNASYVSLNVSATVKLNSWKELRWDRRQAKMFPFSFTGSKNTGCAVRSGSNRKLALVIWHSGEGTFGKLELNKDVCFRTLVPCSVQELLNLSRSFLNH